MMTVRATTAGLEATVRRLQRQVSEITARLDAMGGVVGDEPPGRPSKEKLAWAKRYGLDLDAFVPVQPPPLGTHTMTVAEAMRELDLSAEQVRRHLRSGQLRGTPLGGRAGWRVSRADVGRFKVAREAMVAGRGR